MLLRFAVENFRSVKDSVELQMTAVNYYKERSEQLIVSNLPGLSGVRYLRAAAIYGPNASGKTTIWRALSLMRTMVIHSAAIPSTAVHPLSPFGLDPACENEPTRFLVTFTALDDIRYEYSFAFNESTIFEEELAAFPKGHRQVWFKRYVQDGGSIHVDASSYLRVPAVVKPLLNDNMLLLSLLANYPNTKCHDRIKPVVQWFAEGLDLYSRAPEAMNDFPYSGDIINGDRGSDFMRSFIQSIIRKADIGISQARVESRPIPEELRELLDQINGYKPVSSEDDFRTIVFKHEALGAEMELDFDEESDGTKQLFGLSGHIAKALESGSTLFVDEIDSSLHSVLVTEIIRTFLNPRCNPRGAQLLFTAHNPCLMDDRLMRRDQIWFTEKGFDGAMRLYPLSDYSPRKDETVVSGYLAGRYSAIPVVPECFGKCIDCEGE